MDWLIIIGLGVAGGAAGALWSRRARLSRLLAAHHAGLTRVSCAPVAPDAGHAALAPLVAEVEAWGYRVSSHVHYTVAGVTESVTLLVGDDLSVVDVAGHPTGAAAAVATLLGDGRAVLETLPSQSMPSAPGRLLQVFPGASIAELVARHREAVGWLDGCGIAAVAPSGGARQVVETSARLLARVPPPSVAEARALARGTVTTHLGPLADQPWIDEQLRAAGLLALRPADPRWPGPPPSPS